MTRRALALLLIGVPVCIVGYCLWRVLLAGAYAWHWLKHKVTV